MNNKKRIGLFVSFDKSGEVGEYIFYLLKDIYNSIERLVFIRNGKLNNEGRRQLSQVTSEIIIRDNIGYDAAAWKFALTSYIGWDNICKYDELILFNDSFYGPFFTFKSIFSEMDKRHIDFWGITKYGKNNTNYEIPLHIQTYFITIRKKMFSSDAFKFYWENQPIYNNYSKVVKSFELKFTKYFQDRGFTWDVYYSNDTKRVSIKYSPYYHIKYNKLPILKRKFLSLPLSDYLQKNCREDLVQTLEYLNQNSIYNSSFIWKDLTHNVNNNIIYNNFHLNYILPTVALNKKRIINKKILIMLNIKNINNINEKLTYINHIPEEINVIIISNHEIQKKLKEIYISDRINFFDYEKHSNISNLILEVLTKITQFDYFCFCHDINKDYEDLTSYSYDKSLWENLLANDLYINNIIDTFENNKDLGLLLPPKPYYGDFYKEAFQKYWWEDLFIKTKKLLLDFKLNYKIDQRTPSASFNTGFWLRTKTLEKIIAIGQYELKKILASNIQNDKDCILINKALPFIVQNNGYYYGTCSTVEYASIQITDLQYILFSIKNKSIIKQFKKFLIDIKRSFSSVLFRILNNLKSK